MKRKLTNEQEEIVMCMEKIVKVSALAGSGKTTVIKHHIKHLIETGIKAEEILCLSYETAGKTTLNKRLRTIPGVDIQTIHTFAWDIITSNGYHPTKITDLEKEEILRDLLNKEGIDASLVQIRETLKKFSMAYNNYHVIGKKLKEGDYGLNKKEVDIFLRFNEKFKDSKKPELDFDRSIRLACKILKENPSLAEKYKYVIVDEAHDVTKLLSKLICLLGSKQLFIVGDENQNIYIFKGSNEFLLKEDLVGKLREGLVKAFDLSESFRFSKENRDYINSFMKLNSEHLKGTFTGNKKEAGIKPIVLTGTEKEENDTILEICSNLDQFGLKYSDVAVISRKNKNLKNITSILKNNKIPLKTKGENFMNLAESRKYIALANVVCGKFGKNNIFFKVCLKEFVEKVGNKAFESYFNDRKINTAYLKEVSNQLSGKQLKSTGEENLNNFLDFLIEASTSKTYSISEKFDIALSGTNFVEKMKDGEKIEIFNLIKKRLNRSQDLNEFLNMEDLMDGDEIDGVTVSSIHSVKGKEYRLVILLGAGDKSFISKKGSLLEEARIAMVGITRAKDLILLMHRQNERLCSFFHVDSSLFTSLKKA